MIEVVSPGALTTVQDLGRTGFGASGVPPSGAFDRFALEVANMLAGNEAGAAALECTLSGPSLRFAAGAVVAITGSRFDAHLGGSAVPFDTAFRVSAGSVLTVGRARTGARCIVSVSGGIAVEPVLGSRSTHVRAALGPAVLEEGMHLPVGEARDVTLKRCRVSTEPAPDVPVHVIGDFDGVYTVTDRADRAGVRLDGPALDGAEVDPQANPLGAIQVPPDGLPIVLGPDRPITGGYRTVACVVEHDLPLIANARPGDTLRFVTTTVEHARALLGARATAVRAAIEEIA